ncbi:MBL fold metallo-hydrolase [Aureimonas sp. ME7]|uniref:MBL fold metallo-hydrolase n=1 Tax=Aureimonas sp. ME7 TaxID=2744252 RepID=UPI0015F6518C|nr:MBL fold metallo-hydrolase [Aureimonas sp. ME7]
MKQINEDAWLLSPGNANAVLLAKGNELTLVDAGFAGKERVVLDAIAALGRRPSNLKHLVFTHSHPDHIGSSAAIVEAAGARTYMHALDAPFAETGGRFRPMTAAPGLLHGIMYRLVWHPNVRMRPFRIDQHVADGETLPLAGGLRAVHVPGHAAGQLAYLWRGDRLLIGGDVFMNIFGLADPVGFEDEAQARRSQRKLAALQFDKAVFGHGGAILSGASDKVRRKVH